MSSGSPRRRELLSLITENFAVCPADADESLRDGAPIDVRIRYNRGDGNYADWGLHLWQVNDAGQYIADYPGVTWPSPLVRSTTGMPVPPQVSK